MQNLKVKIKTYTKKDVAKRVAELRDEKVYVAEQWTDTIFSALRDIMMKANPELRIEVRDFGVFEVKLTKSKPKARNPRTGETIFVPPRRKTHFKPSKKLKNFLQQPIDSESPTGEPERTQMRSGHPESDQTHEGEGRNQER